MKKLKLFAVLCIMLVSCNSDDSSDNEFILDDLRYEIKSYIIEQKVDLNGDGIFSNDLVQEKNCFWNLEFRGDLKLVAYPLSGSVFARVDLDANDNPVQSTRCGHGDGLGAGYQLEKTTIRFLNSFNGELFFTGELSENNKKITITYPNRLLWRDTFIYEDGSYGEYEGDVTAVYELVE